MTKTERTVRLFEALQSMGFTYNEADALRRIQMTLHRWDESECGNSNNYASWCVVRDETTGKTYREVSPHTGKSYREPIADRETGALKRLAKIMSNHPELWAYHQSDCRGCALYVGRKADVNGFEIASVYNRGVAVCV